jgi:hypothetical protein
MSTAEIAKAILNLTAPTLTNSLKTFSLPSEGDRDQLLVLYQNAVLNVGLANFINKLKDKDLKSSIKTLGLEYKSEEASRTSLEEKLKDAGIGGLIEKADEELLKNFCETLGLESTDKDDMIKQIADEVMLTGMESFLNKLSLGVLKSHCTEMELPSTGVKAQLVER